MAGRALVLGGGGAAGQAWEIGVIAGLLDGGLDATRADLVIGASAGATTAAQITGEARPPALLDAILSAAPPLRAGGPENGAGLNRPTADHMQRTAAIIAAAADADDMRRRMGAAALAWAAQSGVDGQAAWRARVAARLPGPDWPPRALRIVAVDADSGAPVILDRASGVDLVDAVAASCANGFGVAPYRLGGRRCIDGGYRSVENADLAAGYGQVLVLAPFGGRARTPPAWGLDLATQAAALRAGGARVETIAPDAAARAAFGGDVMDLSTRAPAARAGYAQGRALAGPLAAFWD